MRLEATGRKEGQLAMMSQALSLTTLLQQVSPRTYIEAARARGRAALTPELREDAAYLYLTARRALRDRPAMADPDSLDLLELVWRALWGEYFLDACEVPRYRAYAQLSVLEWALEVDEVGDRRLDRRAQNSWAAIRVLINDLISFEAGSLAGLVDWQQVSMREDVIRKRLSMLRDLRDGTLESKTGPFLNLERPPTDWDDFRNGHDRSSALIYLTALPQTQEHDEYLFLRTIHITECCAWGVLSSVMSAMESIILGSESAAVSRLNEGAEFAEFLTPLFSAFKTMPPEHFRRFREATGNASAIQSRAYQLVQILTQGLDAKKSGDLRAIPEVRDLVVKYEGSGFRSLDRLITDSGSGSSSSLLASAAERLDQALYQWRAIHLGIARVYLADLMPPQEEDAPGGGEDDSPKEGEGGHDTAAETGLGIGTGGQGPEYLERHYKSRLSLGRGQESDRFESDARLDESEQDMSVVPSRRAPNQ